MNVLVVSGFLGSGKTTFLLGLTRHLLARGTSVAVIENEVGSVAIDGASLRGGAGVEVRELFAGCICCSLREELGRVVAEIRETRRPEVLLIEPSGVAGPEIVTDAVGDHLGAGDAIATVQIVDAARTAQMLSVRAVLPPFLERSVEVCDIVILNKADQLDGEGRTRMGEWLARRGRADAFELDVRDGAAVAVGFVPSWRAICGWTDGRGTEEPVGGSGPVGRAAPLVGATPTPILTPIHRQLLADCVARATPPPGDGDWEARLVDRVGALLETVHDEVVHRECPDCSGHLKARLDPPGVALSVTDSSRGVTTSVTADTPRGDRDAGGHAEPGAGDGSAPRAVELRVQGIYSLPVRSAGTHLGIAAAASPGSAAPPPPDLQAILDREIARWLPEFDRGESDG